jgi:hypothetical protein
MIYPFGKPKCRINPGSCSLFFKEWDNTPKRSGRPPGHAIAGYRRNMLFRIPIVLALIAVIATLCGGANAGSSLSGKPTFVVHELRQNANLKIIAYGDMRFTDPANTTSTAPRARKFLVDQIALEKPDALFVSGDIPFRGGVLADWDVYRSETAPWTAAGLRVYPVIGNHELIPDEDIGLPNYFRQFPWLAGRCWYSVEIGNVELIALDSNSRFRSRSFRPGVEQRRWLDAQLDHIPAGIDFVFVLLHMPLINDVQSEVVAGLPDAQELELRRDLEAHSTQAHAKFIVVAGHIHNYERFERNGISYIVSGGGGAKPYAIYARSPQDLYRDPGFPNFNYVVFNIHGKQADAAMYRIADSTAATLSMEVKERFTLTAN